MTRMDKIGYAASELERQLERGPYQGEDFFRLKVTGDGESRWVNITAEELEVIVRALRAEKMGA